MFIGETEMAGNLIPEVPVTQESQAVKTLITYLNHGEEPKEMPPFFRLSGEMVLVLSNKKDVYYATTPKTCSCPSQTFRHGTCKHQRKFFPVKESSLEWPDVAQPFKPVLE